MYAYSGQSKNAFHADMLNLNLYTAVTYPIKSGMSDYHSYM